MVSYLAKNYEPENHFGIPNVFRTVFCFETVG